MLSDSATPNLFRALAITPISIGNAAPVLYELTGDSTEIGSTEDNAIVLSDVSIAPHHVAVRRSDGRDHLLVDLSERRYRDQTWRTFRDGDAYLCPHHGHLERLDERNWCPQCKRKTGSLWLMRPLHPGDTFDIGIAFRAKYIVQERQVESETKNATKPAFPSIEMFESSPRKELVSADETVIPSGTQPTDDSNLWRWQPEGVPFPIFMHQRVNLAITQHAKQNSEREVGGVLLGEVRKDEHDQLFVIVTHAIKAEFADETRGHLTFTQKTWLAIHHTREQHYPDKVIVGWYHTHPGWSIFLSQWDLFIHQNFFKQPWQIALVVDPSVDRAGFFVWKDNQIDNPHAPLAPFRLAELDGWSEMSKPHIRIKLTSMNATR